MEVRSSKCSSAVVAKSMSNMALVGKEGIGLTSQQVANSVKYSSVSSHQQLTNLLLFLPSLFATWPRPLFSACHLMCVQVFVEWSRGVKLWFYSLSFFIKSLRTYLLVRANPSLSSYSRFDRVWCPFCHIYSCHKFVV